MTPYTPYEPTKFERRIDSLIRTVAPKRAQERWIAREKMNYFRYLTAHPTSSRANSTPTTSGEWLRGSIEKQQVMWNAINLIENSGLCSGIVGKFETYTCGSLRWQARTGDKNVNKQYEDYMRFKLRGSNIDVNNRDSLRQMCMLDVKSMVVKGDVGTAVVRGEDGELYLQGIEGDRIGDPYKLISSDQYVRGLVLDKTGRIQKALIYHRDRRSGYYRYDTTFDMVDENGLPQFLLLVNPISYDDKRGVSVFKSAIDNATYIENMRNYELQALLWAASYAGVFYTKSGLLPQDLPFAKDQNLIDTASGNKINTFEVRPNQVIALGADGEKLEVFQHSRPSPNVIGMYENTIRDIAIGTGLSYPFVYDLGGISGPAVRQASAQDARAIHVWQEILREQKLDKVMMLLLGDAIARKKLPYHKNWMEWQWFFPAKPTIDVGRESQANINELEAGLNTGAIVSAESGYDYDEIQEQLGQEMLRWIDICQTIEKKTKIPWQDVYVMIKPPPRGSDVSQLLQALIPGMQEKQVDNKKASSNGVSADGEGNFSRNGGDNIITLDLKKKDSAVTVMIRHGETEFNSEDNSKESPERIRGHIDVPLNKDGEKQAADLGEELRGKGITRIYTSDLQRAHKTAKIVADKIGGVPVVPRYNLRPWKLGKKIEGHKATEVQPLINHLVDNPDEEPDGGETMKDFASRFLGEINDIQEKHPDENIGIVTHYRGFKILDAWRAGGKKGIDRKVFKARDTDSPPSSCYFMDKNCDVVKPTTTSKFYSDDQPRDDHGRWTDGGSASLVKKPSGKDDIGRYVREIEASNEHQAIVSKLNEYQKEIPGVPVDQWSKIKNTDASGNYTPERQKLHEQIVQSMLNPKAAVEPGTAPKYAMLIGQPGSGKSTALLPQVQKLGEFTTIDPDEIKKQLGAEGWNAAVYHSESKDIAEQSLLPEAIRQHHNVLIDGTGTNFSKSEALINAMAEHGYETHIFHADVAPEVAVQRAWARSQKPNGRFVPLSYITNDVDGRPGQTYDQLKKNPNVKSWVQIDNNGTEPKLRERGSRTSEKTVTAIH